MGMESETEERPTALRLNPYRDWGMAQADSSDIEEIPENKVPM